MRAVFSPEDDGLSREWRGLLDEPRLGNKKSGLRMFREVLVVALQFIRQIRLGGTGIAMRGKSDSFVRGNFQRAKERFMDAYGDSGIRHELRICVTTRCAI